MNYLERFGYHQDLFVCLAIPDVDALSSGFDEIANGRNNHPVAAHVKRVGQMAQRMSWVVSGCTTYVYVS